MKSIYIIFIIAGFYFISFSPSKGGSNEIYATYGEYHGASMLVSTTNHYTLGSAMLVAVTITNISNETIHLATDNPREFDYGFLLYRPDGGVLNKSQDISGSVLERAKEESVAISSYDEGSSVIQPGQSLTEVVNFAACWKIETDGIYDLLVTRVVNKKTGVLVSDKIRINIERHRVRS